MRRGRRQRERGRKEEERKRGKDKEGGDDGSQAGVTLSK